MFLCRCACSADLLAQDDVTPEAAEALLFLASAALREGALEDAEACAKRVLEMPFAQETAEAGGILRDAAAVRLAQGQGHAPATAGLVGALHTTDTATSLLGSTMGSQIDDGLDATLPSAVGLGGVAQEGGLGGSFASSASFLGTVSPPRVPRDRRRRRESAGQGSPLEASTMDDSAMSGSTLSSHRSERGRG